MVIGTSLPRAEGDGPAKHPPPVWTVGADRRQSYVIRIVDDVLAPGNPVLAELGADRKRRVIVLDAGLPDDTAARVTAYFAHFGMAAETITVPGGERCKDFATLKWLLHSFETFGLERATQPVVLMGGGALLDLGGFAASIYRRGVPFVRVPTTLLAFVDASVGAKTGINFGLHKNLIGTFQPPLAALLDKGFFGSLDQAEIVSGLGEILKLAVGCDGRLLEALESCADALVTRRFDEPGVSFVLNRAVQTILIELEPNLYETELRRRVDLGHSFSQPLELGRANLRHGEAVAVDVLVSSIIARNRGLLTADDVDRVWRLARRLGHPVDFRDWNADELWQSIMERSRHRGGAQRLPLPSPLGDCVFVDDLRRDVFDRSLAEFEERRRDSETTADVAEGSPIAGVLR